MKISRRVILAAAPAAGLLACTSKDQDDQTLRIGIDNAPDSFDPAIGQFAAAALLYKQLFTPLTNYGPNGGTAPGLAARWQISDDGLQWRFTLQRGLFWSDGAPITAHDVVFSVRRMLSPNSASADAGDFFALRFAKQVLNGQVSPEKLGVRALSGHQVQFTLDQPLGVFDELLREFYPVPAHIIAKANTKWPLPPDFVGSGPYVLSHATQQSISLRTNAYAPDPAAIRNIFVSVIEDAATRARMVRANDLDLIVDPPANQLADLRQNSQISLYGWDGPKLVYVKINHLHPALGRPQVRRALDLAIDRQFIAKQLYRDTAKPAFGILPHMPPPTESYPQRQAKARQVLREAGFEKGLQLTLLHSGGFRERVCVILAENWKAIGVDCQIQASDSQGLYAFIEAGEFDLAMASFDRGLKRENWRLIEPFATNGFAANFNWNNPQYGAEVTKARTQAGPDKRDQYAQKAADILQHDTAIFPIAFERKFWLAGAKLGGFSDAIPPDQWRVLRWK